MSKHPSAIAALVLLSGINRAISYNSYEPETVLALYEDPEGLIGESADD